MTNLTSDERYFIACSLRLGKTQRWISDQLGRDPSTISREIKRNGCSDGRYRYKLASDRARDRKRFRTVVDKLLSGDARRVVNYLLLRK
jgi:IS30 family transposase